MRDRRTRAGIGPLGVAVAALGSICLAGAGPGPAAEPVRTPGQAEVKSRRDAQALAATVDRMLRARWVEAKATPSDPADDAEFLRRATLDLVGKIPTAAEARAFLEDPTPTAAKRAQLVDKLLDSPSYIARATELYRQLLLPEADTEGQGRFVAPAFSAWLRKKVVEEAGYDRIAREVLTARLGGRANTNNTANGRSEPTAAGFFTAKEGKPENLAAATARAFLGVRLECAQCHNHPFAKWKRDEFWALAAFFAGVQKQGPEDGYGAVRETANRRELTIPGTDRSVKAAFLDNTPLTWKPRDDAREVLAGWVTSPKNPYFARAAANRLWARFFGAGLVDPVDDMGGDNEPVAPEVLDELARQFVDHGYDLKFLIRALTATEAYSLSSVVARPEPSAPVLFSAMPVRGLSAGQLFACLAQATGFRGGMAGTYLDGGFVPPDRFFDLFANRDEKVTESQTSILQALTLMNGQIVTGATSLEAGDTLAAVADAPYLDTAGRVEELYLAALTRRPTPEESKLLVTYIDRDPDPAKRSAALADAFWAILNGPEFKHNH